MSTAIVATIVSLLAISIAMAAEFLKLCTEQPSGFREWTIGLVDVWTKAQINYLKNLHWILLAMIVASGFYAAFGPEPPVGYPFE